MSGYLKNWIKICKNNQTFQLFWISPNNDCSMWVQCDWTTAVEIEDKRRKNHYCLALVVRLLCLKIVTSNIQSPPLAKRSKSNSRPQVDLRFDSLSFTLWIYCWLLWIVMDSPQVKRIRFQSSELTFWAFSKISRVDLQVWAALGRGGGELANRETTSGQFPEFRGV